MYDHATPTIRQINPEHIILYGSINDLNSEKIASEISTSIELANSAKNETNTIHIWLIVPRDVNLQNKVKEVNRSLTNVCQQRKLQVTSHTDTTDRVKNLNKSALYLNKYGALEFAKTFKKFLYLIFW